MRDVTRHIIKEWLRLFCFGWLFAAQTVALILLVRHWGMWR